MKNLFWSIKIHLSDTSQVALGVNINKVHKLLGWKSAPTADPLFRISPQEENNSNRSGTVQQRRSTIPNTFCRLHCVSTAARFSFILETRWWSKSLLSGWCWWMCLAGVEFLARTQFRWPTPQTPALPIADSETSKQYHNVEWWIWGRWRSRGRGKRGWTWRGSEGKEVPIYGNWKRLGFITLLNRINLFCIRYAFDQAGNFYSKCCGATGTH